VTIQLRSPIYSARISQRFGEHPEWYPGYDGHPGIDYAAPVGSCVYAAHTGECIVGYDSDGYGWYVIVRATEYETLYAHLQTPDVVPGECVQVGAHIGYVGMTGRTTGPHLHFGLRPIPRDMDNGYHGYIDPEPYLVQEGEYVSKLTWHIQDPCAWRWPSWLKGHITGSGTSWVKIMDPDQSGKDPFPGLRTISRLWFPDDADKRLIPRGAVGAREYVEGCLPRIRGASWVYAWEGPNEPDTSTLDAVRQWAEFETARVRIMHEYGYRTVSGCFGTGRPEGDDAQQDAAWQIIGPAIAETDYLGLHEYGMHAMQPPDGWHLLRYRRAVAYLEKHGYRIPPILITETGIDYSGDPDNDGWRVALNGNVAEYICQLAWYDSEICRDDIVQAAFVFTAAPHGGQWQSFELTEDISTLLCDHIRSTGPEQRTPYALTETDVQDARMTLATYPATMKACVDREYVWCAEWQAPDGGQCCLAWFDGRYRVIKLEPHTWKLVDEVIL